MSEFRRLELAGVANQANLASVREACELLDVNKRTLLSAIRRGIVPSAKQDGKHVVDLRHVEAWLAVKQPGRKSDDYVEQALGIAEIQGLDRDAMEAVVQRWVGQ